MNFYIENTPKGFIVSGMDYMTRVRLRNFGDNQSAAIEFRNYCNEYVDDARAMRYAKSFDENALYTYPEIKGDKCALRRQRSETH